MTIALALGLIFDRAENRSLSADDVVVTGRMDRQRNMWGDLRTGHHGPGWEQVKRRENVSNELIGPKSRCDGPSHHNS